MVRHSILSIDYLEKLTDKHTPSLYRNIHGVDVKISSQRYELFKKNICCVRCGIEGKFLAIEKLNNNIHNYNINVYSINKNGDEILMTKDHIIPKSKGGKDIMKNYQTMCINCNKYSDSKSLKHIINNYIFFKTNKQINKIDKICYKLNINVSNFWRFYLKHKDEHNNTEDFLNDIFTYFHYYLDNELDKLFKNLNITFQHFFFDMDKKSICMVNPEEFNEKILNLDFKTKKKLTQNKIFAYFMKKCKVNIFNVKEIRVLKLEILQK